MKPKFSILTACFNNARFLVSYFESVVALGDDVEIIFVDDHSNDGSYEIAKRYEHRIKLIRNDRRLFCSTSYNLAIRNATAPYCGVVDADDAIYPDAVNTVLNLYKSHPEIGYIYTQHTWCDENLNKVRNGISSLPPKQMSIVEAALKFKHCFSHWRTCKRKIVSPDILFPHGLKWAVDKNMGFILEEHGRGGFYPEPLYFYRYYKDNMSRTHAGEQKQTWQGLAKIRQRDRNLKRIKAYPIKNIKL